MSSNVYLKIDGIDGESTANGFEKHIEIANFSYSCYQPVTEARSGSIHTTGRANHGTFNLSKATDLASADICAAMWSGKTIKNAVVTATINNGDAVIKYLTITLDNVVISNFSLQGGGNSIANEELSLSFSKIKIDYHHQSADGKDKGQKSALWDLALEKKG